MKLCQQLHEQVILIAVLRAITVDSFFIKIEVGSLLNVSYNKVGYNIKVEIISAS